MNRRPPSNPSVLSLLLGMACAFTPASAGPVAETSSANDAPPDAQALDVGSHPCLPRRIVVVGEIAAPSDKDYFAVRGRRGDLLYAHAFGTGDDIPTDNTILPFFRLEDDTGLVMKSPFTIAPFDDTGADDYPPDLPVGAIPPGGGVGTYLPANGTYYIRISATDPALTPLANSDAGPYELEVVLERSGFEREPAGAVQVIYLDFDGGTINFGGALRTFSPMADSLDDWGLNAGDEAALAAKITEAFALALDRANDPELDGDDPVNAYFAYEIKSSAMGDPQPYDDLTGNITQPYHTVVVFGENAGGGANAAETTELGNYAFEQFAYVNTEWLSRQSSEPYFHFSANSIAFGPSVQKIDVVAAAAGRLAAHELGHLLGCLHTNPCNAVPSLMDQGLDVGATLADSILGVGPDDLYGTSDDGDPRFRPDELHITLSESCPPPPLTGPLALIAFDQPSNEAVAFGLSTRPCPADMNLDGVRNLDDLDLWAAAFAAGDPSADLDGNCVLNVDDVDAFTALFTGPCP